MIIIPIGLVLDGDGAEFAVHHAGAAFDALVVLNDIGLFDDAVYGVRGAVARAFGTAFAQYRVYMEEEEFLVRARKIFFNDAFGLALAFENCEHLTGDALAKAAASGVVDEIAQQGDHVHIEAGGGRGLRGRKQILHLAGAFTAGDALAAALVAGEFVEDLESRKNFRSFFHEEASYNMVMSADNCLSAQPARGVYTFKRG
jgi:hypothetical protein